MASVSTRKLIIDPAGNLTIKVIQRDYDQRKDSSGEHPISDSLLVVVNEELLVGASDVLSAMLTGGFAESKMSTPSFEEDSVSSFVVWLYQIHSKNFPDELFKKISVKDLWFTIEQGRKYFFNIEKLQDWFKKWYSQMNMVKCPLYGVNQQLLFPCFTFGHHVGFAQVTKKLAYAGNGHVVEANPTRHLHLHLQSSVVQQLNFARASLRTKLLTGIHEPFKTFYGSLDCECKFRASFNYGQGLSKTGVWPLEVTGQHKSMDELLDTLKNFECKAVEGGHSSHICHSNFMKTTIEPTIANVRENFDGLCIHCMNISKPKTGDSDLDYWNHDRIRQFDKGCSFRHGQPTWYFSFMGRKTGCNSTRKTREIVECFSKCNCCNASQNLLRPSRGWDGSMLTGLVNQIDSLNRQIKRTI